ncbi:MULTISPECIES: hypothetical protein [Nitrosomonas]|uniref:hypothetical protein n=1 Tax=Nitrosomonas TaxID=914 RepID=UPI000A841136|nr:MULTISPECIES: hypothetical protein [Nitrosomonas]UVS60452.1 hypothetical protein NX761_13160 [Nitrosomonas sp. PLL12]
MLRIALGLGALIQRVILATPTQQRLATCAMIRPSFSRADTPRGGMIADMSSENYN